MTTRPKPKTKIKINLGLDLEFYSIHFGKEINNFFKELRKKSEI